MKRILHIEDNAATTQLFRSHLEQRFGTDVRYDTSPNMDELMGILGDARSRKTPYDLVILDNDTLGKTSGLNALPSMRAQGHNMHAILHASIHNMDQGAVFMFAQEYNTAYIPKPESATVFRVIEALFEQS